MGAENSRAQQGERERALKNQANLALNRQKQLYENQCKALETALQKQQTAYMELKKKEEIQKEVERLLKEKQSEESAKIANQQASLFNVSPSAPPAEINLSQNHHQSVSSFQSQTLVQQSCPTIQFSNIQANLYNENQIKQQSQICHGAPINQFHISPQQNKPSAPVPLLPTPQAGPSYYQCLNPTPNVRPRMSNFQGEAGTSLVKQNKFTNLTSTHPRILSEAENRESSSTTHLSAPLRSWEISRRQPKKKVGNEEDIKCCSCGNAFGLYIYQCSNGHSSCKDCKLKGYRCGQCASFIKDLRNFPLEAYVAEFVRPCPNAAEGCNREHKLAEMEDHLKSCPFKELYCPLKNIFGKCSWIGKFSQLRIHFCDKHPEHYRAEVDKEITIPKINIESQTVDLAVIGSYNFLVHSKVTKEQIYFVVQVLGTESVALQWTYQLHVYNKSVPRQKFEYTDACHSANVDVNQIFERSKCANMPIGYVQTFINRQNNLTYKFFITKSANRVRGKNVWKK